MARNSSGNMALLQPQTPFIANTTIVSTDVNAVMSDIANEITNSLDRSGRGAMTSPLIVPASTAATPSVAFTGDTDTGVYGAAANTVGIATGGSVRATFSTNGMLTVDGALATPALSFISDPNTGIYRAGADDLRVAAGGVDIAKATTKLSVSAATAATGATRQDALSLTNGDLDLSAVTAPTSTTAATNRLTPTNIPKAWASIAITNADPYVPTVDSGFNIASIARQDNGFSLRVTFAAAMANTTYVVTAFYYGTIAGVMFPFTTAASGATLTEGRTTGYVDLLAVDWAGAAVDLDSRTGAGGAGTMKITVSILAVQ